MSFNRIWTHHGLRFLAVMGICVGILAACKDALVRPEFQKPQIASMELPKGKHVVTETFNPWKPFNNDGLHDPEGPAFELLQRPNEALSGMPRDNVGNYVRWVKALEDGHINPRTNIHEETEVNILDLDIFMSAGGSLPVVKFPHYQHTLWLDCTNCHDQIFKMEAGANNFTMVDILNGQYCGHCHGAVAFPLTECNRCHSVPHPVFDKMVRENQVDNARDGKVFREANP